LESVNLSKGFPSPAEFCSVGSSDSDWDVDLPSAHDHVFDVSALSLDDEENWNECANQDDDRKDRSRERDKKEKTKEKSVGLFGDDDFESSEVSTPPKSNKKRKIQPQKEAFYCSDPVLFNEITSNTNDADLFLASPSSGHSLQQIEFESYGISPVQSAPPPPPSEEKRILLSMHSSHGGALSPPPVVAPTVHMRPLDRFILQQSASGAFVLNDLFLNAAGLVKSKQNLLDSMPQQLKDEQNLTPELKEAIWATALALAVLEIKFSELQDEWVMISQKSSKFVTKELKKTKIQPTILYDAAKNAL